tara:strand:- start:2726 stop:2926 length:201 start_codon:yes stop_codon:yes gene_type:complete
MTELTLVHTKRVDKTAPQHAILYGYSHLYRDNILFTYNMYRERAADLNITPVSEESFEIWRKTKEY